MTQNPKPIPDTYRRVTPSLVVGDAAAALAFYAEVFGAIERARIPGPGGAIAHAEIEIGDSVVMLSDAFPERGVKAPAKGEAGTASGIFLYIADVDAVFKKAVDAGATVTMPLENQFWGDRYGKLRDPFGHEWHLATHVEDVSPEEMGKRAQAAMAG